MIELRHINKTYKNTILEDVNVTINDGDIVAIIGPSGCGKSTLLNCFNLLEMPTSGQVIFDGVDLTAPGCKIENYRQKIGMVFQSFNLFAHRTVLENVVDPQIKILHRSRQEATDKAIECLKLVGMTDRKFSYPNQLSGGQKQRAAIARCIAMDPEIILMDEPTSALDPSMVGEVEYVINQLAKAGRTMLIVTHSMSFARQVSNRVFYIDEKGIYEEGPTKEIFTNPKKEKTRYFITQLKTLEITYDSNEHDYIDDIQRINEFGNRFSLSKKCINNMQRLVEEICVVNLIPKLPPESKVRAIFEYDETKDSLTFNVYHPGKVFGDDLITDEISKTIVNASLADIKFKELSSD